MSWFHDLTGFDESAETVRTMLEVDGTAMRSLANGRVMQAGRLTTPTLRELRAHGETSLPTGQLSVREVVADVAALHRDPANAKAVFQVASQFNLLEMAGPSVTPEAGVTCYEHDKTQGPACAIACGAGTIWRNWFVEIDGEAGQTTDSQLDMLADVGADLGNPHQTDNRLWTMRNGYALATGNGLDSLADHHDLVRIGRHADTEVTLGNAGHTVTQLYCSALPAAYTNASAEALEPLARMILNSSYEATLWAARRQHASGGSPIVYLTLLGGGVFGNKTTWITDALRRAFAIHRDSPLDVRIVSYGGPSAAIAPLLTTA
jgi:hypothetical protein